MKAIVYGLFDPKHCVIRYIGKTMRTDEVRLEYHFYEAYIESGWHRPVCRWIRKSQQIAAKAYGLTKQQVSRSVRFGREYSNLTFEFVESL